MPDLDERSDDEIRPVAGRAEPSSGWPLAIAGLVAAILIFVWLAFGSSLILDRDVAFDGSAAPTATQTR